MSISHLFIVLPIRVIAALIKSLFHSWLRLKWTPSSRDWLLQLDRKIRSHIVHKHKAEFVSVTLGKEVHQIWTVKVEGDKQDTVPIVLIHGMGGGSNMFLNNIDALAEKRNVILLDLPGFGLSSRPELRVKQVDGWWVDTTTDDIEEFYTEILDLWLKELGLDKIILLGHSYGGYISSVYCLKYPEKIKHLILADPWGYPQRPAHADQRPFMRNKPLRLLSKLYAKMYIFTPIRALGPLGPVVFRSLRADLGRKFSPYFPDHTFSYYLYTCNTCDHPSGEIGFSRVSIPFGWAKKPLVERVPDWDRNLDVTFIYGARSWVDSQPGYETKNHRHPNYVDVQVISGAGHHVYADRPLAFNHMVDMICEAVDWGRKPNISFESEERKLAMSTLRRRASCSSQAEMCNDEAGLRQLRSFSDSEMSQGFVDELDEDEGAVGGVMFSLGNEEDMEDSVSPPPVVSDLGEDSMLKKKSTLKTSKSGVVKNVKFSADNLLDYRPVVRNTDGEQMAGKISDREDEDEDDGSMNFRKRRSFTQ